MPSGSRTPTATLFFRIDLIYHGPGRRATPRVCIPPTTAFPAHLTISWALVRDAFRACPLSLPRLPHPLCELRTRTRLDSGQQLNDPTPGLPSLRLSRAPPSRATILLLPKAPRPRCLQRRQLGTRSAARGVNRTCIRGPPPRAGAVCVSHPRPHPRPSSVAAERE